MQCHQLLFASCGFVGSRRCVVERVIEDFAQAGRDRRKLWRNTRGDLIEHALQPFGDELPEEIQVYSVFKGHRDLRETELRKRSKLDHIRKAGHLALDGESNQLL